MPESRDLLLPFFRLVLPVGQFCTKDLQSILRFGQANAFPSPNQGLERYLGSSKPSVLKDIFRNLFFNFQGKRLAILIKSTPSLQINLANHVYDTLPS